MKKTPPLDPGASPEGDLSAPLRQLLRHAVERADGEADDRLVARLIQVTRQVEAECARREAWHAAGTVPPGRHLRSVPAGAGPVPAALMAAVRDVLGELQRCVPLIRLTPAQRRVLRGIAPPLPAEVGEAAVALLERLEAGPRGLRAGLPAVQLRAVLHLDQRLEKYNQVLPAFCRALGRMSALLDVALASVHQALDGAPAS